MVLAKLKYQSPRLTVLGSARDLLLSSASPEVRQAARELAENRRTAPGRLGNKQN